MVSDIFAELLGVALVIASAVAIYIMSDTQVVQELYERFDKPDAILETHTKILRVSSQKQNHMEIMDILKKMLNSLEK